jgi:hypothetical protein
VNRYKTAVDEIREILILKILNLFQKCVPSELLEARRSGKEVEHVI